MIVELNESMKPITECVYGDRESLCIAYTCADSGVEAIAEIEAMYSEIEESNKRRDAEPKAERKRAPSVRVEFTQAEVCRRALVVHAAEVAFEQAKRTLVGYAMVFKCMHGISHLVFSDEAYQHFSRWALADRRAAARELNLARARLATATRGLSDLIAKFGLDPHEQLAARALAILAYDERLLGDGPIVLTRTKDDMNKRDALRRAIIEGTVGVKEALAMKFENGEPMVTKEQFIEITRDETYIPF